MRALVFAPTLLATPAPADVAGTASVSDGDTVEAHGDLSLQCHFVLPSRHRTTWWIRQAEM